MSERVYFLVYDISTEDGAIVNGEHCSPNCLVPGEEEFDAAADALGGPPTWANFYWWSPATLRGHRGGVLELGNDDGEAISIDWPPKMEASDGDVW